VTGPKPNVSLPHHLTEAALSLLPGGDLVATGLADLACNESSIEALLLQICRPRLSRLGFELPVDEAGNKELRLYERLRTLYPRDAYSRYNSLLRKLVSFARALEAERGRELRARSSTERP
jgi:hypothetical protein